MGQHVHGQTCRRQQRERRYAEVKQQTVRLAVDSLRGIGPRFMHLMTQGRKEVEELTGQRAVPVLVTDGGEVITDSHRIADWAERNPAP